MIRLATLLALAATPALAEGRDDPFLICTFSEGREVILAENGEAIEWWEGDTVRPALLLDAPEASPTRTIIGTGPQALRLDLLIDDASAGEIALPKGTALLSETVLTADGALAPRAEPGTCKELPG